MAANSTGEVTVGGERYGWEMRPYAGASSPEERHRGIAVRVRAKDGRERELVITFAANPREARKARVTTVLEKQIGDAIAAALELGWRPDSRGKPFRIEADESP